MTGAANKATFEQHADKVLDAPADRTMLLTTIDLDNFKTINDTHGHAAGDAVVRAFAAKAAAVNPTLMSPLPPPSCCHPFILALQWRQERRRSD